MVTPSWLRPYSAKAFIEYQWDADHLDIYITFRFPMFQGSKPDHALWICNVNDVPKAVTVSAWQDSWTLLLTVPDIAALPDKVTLEYAGPNENLKIIWGKQWEPWGPIVSVEIPPVYTTRIFSTGPAAQDAVAVSGINILFLDCSANAITIGGLIGGVNGQILHLARLCATANDITLEHNKATGNQIILLHVGADETLTGEYGGWVLVCNGTNWYDTSHAKHV